MGDHASITDFELTRRVPSRLNSSSGIDVMDVATTEPSKWREAMSFVILAFLIWPFIAVAFVGTYGLAFWVYFMLNGPPGAQ
jgi:nitrate reductase NapE